MGISLMFFSWLHWGHGLGGGRPQRGSAIFSTSSHTEGTWLMSAHTAVDNLADIVFVRVPPYADLCPSFHTALFRTRESLWHLYCCSPTWVRWSPFWKVYMAAIVLWFSACTAPHTEDRCPVWLLWCSVSWVKHRECYEKDFEVCVCICWEVRILHKENLIDLFL